MINPIRAKIKKLGNAFIILIPPKIVKVMHLLENQEVAVDIHPTNNVLKEMFGAAKGKIKKTTAQILKEARHELGVD